MRDCVVEDAVAFEPVSTRNFPANREINREFFNFTPACDLDARIRPMISGLLSQIPYSMEQRNISAEQGILIQEQGIFSVESQIITDEIFGTHKRRFLSTFNPPMPVCPIIKCAAVAKHQTHNAGCCSQVLRLA